MTSIQNGGYFWLKTNNRVYLCCLEFLSGIISIGQRPGSEAIQDIPKVVNWAIRGHSDYVHVVTALRMFTCPAHLCGLHELFPMPVSNGRVLQLSHCSQWSHHVLDSGVWVWTAQSYWHAATEGERGTCRDTGGQPGMKDRDKVVSRTYWAVKQREVMQVV